MRFLIDLGMILWLLSAIDNHDFSTAFIPGIYLAFKIGSFTGSASTIGNFFRL